ncbi:MAG: hypothetical protein ABH843_06925 [Candidatus Omnitrophota bacterium]
MKLLITIVIGCILISTAYGMDEEIKDMLITHYNYTRNNYIQVDGLMDDFKDSKIDATRAEEKLQDWKEKYRKEMEVVPRQAAKMRDSMLKIYDIAKEVVHDYRPQNLKTKNSLEELDEACNILISELTAVKYLVK